MNIAISACFFSSCERKGIGKYKRDDFKDLFNINLDIILKEGYQVFDYKNKKIIFICPENLGGLGTPRIPAEIESGKTGEDIIIGIGKIFDKNGIDVTKGFLVGANKTLEICKKYNVGIYIAKNNSPSCGVITYDGTFSGILNNLKSGVTATILKQNNIEVIPDSEVDYNELIKF